MTFGAPTEVILPLNHEAVTIPVDFRSVADTSNALRPRARRRRQARLRHARRRDDGVPRVVVHHELRDRGPASERVSFMLRRRRDLPPLPAFPELLQLARRVPRSTTCWRHLVHDRFRFAVGIILVRLSAKCGIRGRAPFADATLRTVQGVLPCRLERVW